MRLDKYIADGKALTRSEARKAIKAGLVKVGGEVVKDIAFHVNEDAEVTLGDSSVEYTRFVYIMLNKPAGYISATEDRKQNTVLDLLDPSYSRYKLFPAGRLDIDTEGFLLLTNDGDLAHNILSPSKKVGKTYFVRLEKAVSDDQLRMLEAGVDIGECVTKPAKTERISENEINLTITEGKFHQIKRMANAIENNVVYLKRLAYGSLYLDEALEKGNYRHLSEVEITNLYNVYKRK